MKTNIVVMSAAALALAFTATACSGTDSGGRTAAVSGASDSGSVTTGSVRELTELAGQNVQVDYTPLTSPADARKKADLIVEGTLTKVEDGIRLAAANPAQSPQAGSEETYVTFVVNVHKVLDGDARRVVGGKVYVSVYTDGTTSPAKLAALNPQAKVVAVLDDITDWSPSPAETVVRPANIPAGAPLYAPYTDGLWLQGRSDTQMFGVGVEADELPTGWKRAKTVNQFSAAFK
ncbi:hypothetical protein [Actinomadura rudentiformis]|uniref:Uncharacterized protein n=1 Tax=Actinomadura rudentiformis TaxID=359158 RepID=A0A6H9YQ93_9ACTN|nr:hypothetical protein [Actinomadura rudentiformis]KAB2343686.1 hypothetical protein F8566_33720 [Actinomadura rudentiformis]